MNNSKYMYIESLFFLNIDAMVVQMYFLQMFELKHLPFQFIFQTILKAILFVIWVGIFGNRNL